MRFLPEQNRNPDSCIRGYIPGAYRVFNHEG
jgi:hypothetical protein